ncbi:MAG: hypothetical protein CVU60_14010 [Deltaproteobacteria bacterium HGW-Deltaproteobacteria-18]|jgi:hypothetical protein|nr:MAG: hypothetical protein CVU60_14010 [Deltaproteobacteria bacterium HGW-Deltaproteobacteria-18]
MNLLARWAMTGIFVPVCQRLPHPHIEEDVYFFAYNFRGKKGNLQNLLELFMARLKNCLHEGDAFPPTFLSAQNMKLIRDNYQLDRHF